MKCGPNEFFEAAHDIFLSRVDVVPVSRREYKIAGLGCRLEIAGETLAAQLTRALAHLRQTQASRAELTIRAWDGPMISPAWSDEDYGPRGEVRGFNTERFRTMFDHGTSSLSLLDRERGVALFWTREGSRLPAYETAAPFRTIFSWWLEEKKRVLIHGGAVAAEGGAALLAGPGGSGKSTVALLCAQAGWKYLADDYCALATGGAPRVFSLYNSAKISRAWLRDVRQLRKLSETKSDMHGDKQLLFLEEIAPDRLTDSAECRVLITPEVSPERTTAVEDATPAEALRALAPSSIFQSSAAGQVAFARLSEFVRRIPVRRLKLGRDTDAIPAAVERCLVES